MGILGEIAKGVAEELMPNTSSIVKKVVGSDKKEKKDSEKRS